MADDPQPAADEVRDQLPQDLDASGYVGPYQFPDNSRRRVPGAIYLVIAVFQPDDFARLSARKVVVFD